MNANEYFAKFNAARQALEPNVIEFNWNGLTWKKRWWVSVARNGQCAWGYEVEAETADEAAKAGQQREEAEVTRMAAKDSGPYRQQLNGGTALGYDNAGNVGRKRMQAGANFVTKVFESWVAPGHSIQYGPIINNS